MTAQQISQIILFLDIVGNPHAEAPGRNGASRTKLDLPPDFAARNPELMSALREQQARLRIEISASAPPLPVRLDPEVARQKRIDEARATKLRLWNEWLAGLPEAEKAAALAKRDAAFAKAAAVDAERAKSVYLGVASEHSVDLANRVIRDPSRRPRRVVVMTQQGARVITRKHPAKESTPKAKSFDPNLVIRNVEI